MKAADLRIRRIDAGINRQAEVSSELGWNVETVIDIERGRIGIDEETYREIENAIARLEARKKEIPTCQESDLTKT